MRAFTTALLLMTSLCMQPASATDLTVNFTATIKETTCAMTLSALEWCKSQQRLRNR